MYKITPHSSSASIRSPIHLDPTSFKKDTKPVDPPQDVDKPHLNVSTSTTTNLSETCSLDISCGQLLHLDPPSHSSDPQDISIVENVEIDFLPEFEVQLDYSNVSPTDVFLGHHDYDLFLLNKEIDTPTDNLNFQNTHVCENEDVILIHATNLSHTFVHPWCSHNQWQLSETNLNTPTLTTTLHNHNSWHNPTLKTWIPLILQVQYQPLSKPPMITAPIPNVLITDWNPVQPIPVPHLFEQNLYR